MFHTLACSTTNVIYWMEPMIPKLYSDRYTNVKLEFDDVEFPMTQRTCALVLRATKSIWNTCRIVIHDAKFTGIAVLVRYYLLMCTGTSYACSPLTQSLFCV